MVEKILGYGESEWSYSRLQEEGGKLLNSGNYDIALESRITRAMQNKMNRLEELGPVKYASSYVLRDGSSEWINLLTGCNDAMQIMVYKGDIDRMIEFAESGLLKKLRSFEYVSMIRRAEEMLEKTEYPDTNAEGEGARRKASMMRILKMLLGNGGETAETAKEQMRNYEYWSEPFRFHNQEIFGELEKAKAPDVVKDLFYKALREELPNDVERVFLKALEEMPDEVKAPLLKILRKEDKQ